MLGSVGHVYIRIRISFNCVKLIFGKGHLLTLGASRDTVFGSSFCQTFRPWGSSSVTVTER